MKKILFLVCLLLCLLLAGCGPQEKNTADSGKVLYTVTDATGTKLSFSEKPQRIVSLNVSADEILLDMVDSKRLAALSLLADDSGICSAGDKVKSVKGRAQGSNLESVLAMQPDLVIIPDYTVEPIQGLRSAGLKVYVCHTPNNVQDIFKFIKEIGSAVGEEAKGEEMAKNMEAQLEAVRKQALQAAGDKPLNVLALSFTGPLGMRGTFSGLCYYAGVHNALDGMDIPYQGNLSEEKMLELNPELIITPSWDYSKKGDPEQFRQRILQNPAYKSIKAVKNGRVQSLHDNYLYSTSQYTVKAVRELAHAAYGI